MLFNTLEQLRKLMKDFSLGNEMDFYVHNACCQILANEKNFNNKNYSYEEQMKSLEPRTQPSEETNAQQ